ncbi:hypothetical protein D3C78_1459550 [compost metagenome]
MQSYLRHHLFPDHLHQLYLDDLLFLTILAEYMYNLSLVSHQQALRVLMDHVNNNSILLQVPYLKKYCLYWCKQRLIFDRHRIHKNDKIDPPHLSDKLLAVHYH